MVDDACFAPEDGGYRSLDLARSYWSRDALGGRAVVGLLGYEIERLHGSDALVPARFTVDMFRLAPFGVVEIRTRLVKDGARLRLVEAELVAGGEAVATASCQLLGPTAAPPGSVWSPGPWASPDPDNLPIGDERHSPRAFDLRWVSGNLGSVTEKRCWIRERSRLSKGSRYRLSRGWRSQRITPVPSRMPGTPVFSI